MPLCRLIYISKYDEPITDKLLQDIEEVSSKNNKLLGITGILIGTKTHFMQVLEGEHEKVNQVFNRISNDERHAALELVSFDLIIQQEFSEWSMKCVALGLLGRILAQRLKKKYGEQNDDLVLPTDPHKAFALLYDLAFLMRNGEIS